MRQHTHVQGISKDNTCLEGEEPTGKLSRRPGEKISRHRVVSRMTGHGAMVLVIAVLFIMLGCSSGDMNIGGGDGNFDRIVANAITSALTITENNAAAFGGLRFTIDAADGALFGFPNQQVLLTLSDDGTRYTLEAGTTVVTGTITFIMPGCTLTDTGELVARLDAETCNVDVGSADVIHLGESGSGEVTLHIRQGGQEVLSAPTSVTIKVGFNGTVTLNDNATPVLDLTPRGTLPSFACLCTGRLVGAAGIEDAFACADLAEEFGCDRSEFSTQPELCSGLAQCCIVSSCAQACTCPSP